MTPTRHAIGLGLRRGWTEFVLSLRSAQDQGFYLFVAVGTLAFLWFNRDNELDGTGLMYPTYALPSILAGLVVFSVIIGPASTLAMEREDGTLLRHKAVPHGMQGYVTGQLVYHSLGLVPMLVTILVPSLLLFDELMHRGAVGWLVLAGALVLGLLATLPLGMLIGAVVPSVSKLGTWGMLPVMLLTAISGIFFPIQALWAWVQVVAQIFPTYWIGLLMRSAFLPDAAATVELGDSWRTGTAVLVLTAWAVAGMLAMPRFLRRMARRQSGSQVQEARDAALQIIK
ncbi:ABC transporter permease [Blastococcus sp. LR1]|uniref:ABC transporter permease n=1 Tax=Blastococcus sp. LR1 TaxID=2877000 RepID=UPI001CCC59F8|nr:ABC transporter permease [Blastococcus sp. LR1]MCA0144767.1 ABC transporter permease [Blastococcus sp. LR1]